MLDLALTAVALLGFAALLVLAVRRHRQDRQPGARELAQVLGAYVLAAALVALRLAPGLPTFLDTGALVVLSVAFATIPVLMLRFAAVFDPLSVAIRRIVLAAWVVVSVGAAVYVLELLSPVADEAFLLVFLALWAFGHGVAATWMFRGGLPAAAVVARRRSQLMGTAIAGLGTVLPLAVLVEDVDALAVDIETATAALVIGVASVAALLLGFAPPDALRWHWARRDRDELATAQRRMVAIDDPDQLATELLPLVMREVGAARAWLLAGDEVVAAHPGASEPPWRPGYEEQDGGTRDVLVRQIGDRHLVIAPTARGHLVLDVDPYALLFGARELDTAAALGVQLDVALDRARLKGRELDAVRESEQARRIADVERVRDDVLATISHEMRTPLTTVFGATSLLKRRWADLDEPARYRMVQRVAANAEDLRAAVEEVLALTAHRLATPSRSSPRPIEVAGMLHRAVSGLEDQLADHEVLVVAPEGVAAIADVTVIEQILQRVLTNAAKFSPSGSPIELEASRAGDGLRISVSDRGHGMAQEDLDQAFEPFYRAGDVLRRETRGLGLGLAVVAALARSVGARVEAESQQGQGTRVTLVLPGALVDAPHEDDAGARSEADMRSVLGRGHTGTAGGRRAPTTRPPADLVAEGGLGTDR